MTGYEFYFGYWWIFPLVMIFFCFLFARRSRGRGMFGCCTPRDFRESPLDILNKRYARGDIDQGEYKEKKKTIINELEKQMPDRGVNNGMR